MGWTIEGNGLNRNLVKLEEGFTTYTEEADLLAAQWLSEALEALDVSQDRLALALGHKLHWLVKGGPLQYKSRKTWKGIYGIRGNRIVHQVDGPFSNLREAKNFLADGNMAAMHMAYDRSDLDEVRRALRNLAYLVSSRWGDHFSEENTQWEKTVGVREES